MMQATEVESRRVLQLALLVLVSACTGAATSSGSGSGSGSPPPDRRACTQAWPGGDRVCHDKLDCRCNAVVTGDFCACLTTPIRTAYVGASCGRGMVGVVQGGSPNCIEGCATTGCKYADEHCELNGECKPISCTSGWRCPPGATCAPGTGTSDEHGCALRACRADDDCTCGTFCVLGRCRVEPGTCLLTRFEG